MNKETLVLLVNSENSVVVFRKHLILLVNPVNPVILQSRVGIPPRARARTSRARAWPEKVFQQM
jgi:hypothetical protein